MRILFLDLMVFVVPGILICILLRLSKFIIPCAITLSYLLAIVNLKLFESFNVCFFCSTTATIVALTILIVVFKNTVLGTEQIQQLIKRWDIISRSIGTVDYHASLQFLLIALLLAYIFVIGPYTEVPADIWQHLENTRKEKIYLGQGLVLGVNPWYVIQATVWQTSDYGFEDYLYWTSLFNTVVFLGAIYSIATCLAREKYCDVVSARWVGVVTILFTYIFFGVGVFSYVRYYTFAPGFFMYPCYLLGICVFYHFLETRSYDTKAAILGGLFLCCLVVTTLVHKQEALFLVLVSSSLLVWKIASNLYGLLRKVGWDVAYLKSDKQDVKWIVYFGLVAVISVGVDVVGNHIVTGPLHRDIFSLGEWITVADNYYVLNPLGQMWGVFGIFGLIVLLGIPIKHNYAMLPIPLLCTAVALLVTIFNPAFVGLFLKYSEQELLWRLCYLVPLPMIGGYVLVGCFMKNGNGRVCSFKHTILIALSICLVILSLYGVLSPEQMKWKKIHTLKKVANGNSYQLWEDLLEELNTYRNRRNILSDPVTGYVIAGTTNHSHQRWKFHKHAYIEFNKPAYSSTSFEDYGGWLIVINQRDGEKSEVGEISGHWPSAIMAVSKHYTKEFVKFVRGTTRFKKVWSKENIEIYEVQ